MKIHCWGNEDRTGTYLPRSVHRSRCRSRAAPCATMARSSGRFARSWTRDLLLLATNRTAPDKPFSDKVAPRMTGDASLDLGGQDQRKSLNTWILDAISNELNGNKTEETMPGRQPQPFVQRSGPPT